MGCRLLREGTFLIGEGGGGGASEGRIISKLFTNWGRAKPVLFTAGGGSHFFQQGRKLLHVAFIKVDSFILFA